MAFLFQKPDRANWCIGYSIRGRRYQKSLHTTDLREAKKQLKIFEDLERARKLGALSRDYFARATRKPIDRPQVRAFLDAWLKDIEATAESKNTIAAYKTRVGHFRDWIITDQGADIELSDLTAEHFRRWRVALIREGRSKRTATNFLKTVRLPFRVAFEDGMIERNWPAQVKADRIEEGVRRNFTLDEIRTLLEKASPFWRWAILLATYTGARLGDVASLTWDQIDLKDGFFRFVQGKTRKSVRVPIARPVLDEVERLPSSDNPHAYLWPDAARIYRDYGSGRLSKQFRNLLVECGFAKPFEDRKGEGKHSRNLHELSFHSLRHSFVTAIKATGAPESVAMVLAGHASKEVSKQYTHVSDEDARRAINKMPDVRAKTKGK